MSRSPKSKTQNASSPDYPLLARKLLEASGEAAGSKLPAGLYVVATPIGHLGDITLRGLMVLASADVIACEDTRTSGAMLAKYGLKKKLFAYHDHNAVKAGEALVQMIAEDKAVALISDAGMPLISDPGYGLVNTCREAGHTVTVIPGANAAVTALAGAGLPTDQFHFAGFLPAKTVARQKKLDELRNVPGTLVFYESPQRVAECLKDMTDVLGATRIAAVARELTKLFEEIRRGNLQELADYYAEHDVKGEIVVMVAPADPEVAAPAYDLDVLLREALRTQTLRDAVAAVSDMTGVKKSQVYGLALKIKP